MGVINKSNPTKKILMESEKSIFFLMKGVIPLFTLRIFEIFFI